MGPPGMRPKTKPVHFQVRWDTRLDSQLYLIPGNLSKKVEKALHLFLARYAKGFIHFNTNSDFLARLNKKDKVTDCIYLRPWYYEMVRSIAITIRVSMAECIRIALEWYVYVFLQKIRSRRRFHFWKNKNQKKSLVPAVSVFVLLRHEQRIYWAVDQVPEMHVQFHPKK